MQISKESEATLKLLCLLADGDSKKKKSILFDRSNLDESSYETILKTLIKNEVIKSNDEEDTIVLKKSPYKISILDVINLIDGSPKISSYLEDDYYEDKDEIDNQLYKLHSYMQKSIDMCYGQVTIGTLNERIKNQLMKKSKVNKLREKKEVS